MTNMQTKEPIQNKKEFFNPRKYLALVQEKISSWQYSYLAYCFIVPVVVMYFVYLAMEVHPFGDGCVLVLDMNGQYVYFFEALRNTVTGDGSFLYTFFRGLGGEFLGMYAYYLASPLSYIVLLFPQSRILEALLTLVLLKVGLCGLTFGFYLHKHTKNQNRAVTIIFSVMYALCAYAVVYQSNTMWIDAIMYLPLVTYGIEQLIKNRKYKLFVVSLALTIMSNYYIGYMTCIYVLLYYFYYSLSNTRAELNPRGERLHMTRSFVRIALFSVLAVAISAFTILSAYYSLTFGKSTFSDPNWSLRVKFDFLDFFTKFLPGSYDTVRPEGLPFVYCGILTLILVPVYFMAKKISAREKVASLLFIAIFVLSFIASPLDLIWHGFQSPNWLNYRYSFMLCFLLLVMAYKGFGNLRSIGEKFILGISAFIILFVTVCDKLEFSSYVESDSKLLELETVWLTIFATVALLVVLCLFIRQKNPLKRESLAGVLTVIVCVEVFCSSLACVVQFDGDVAYSSYSKYNSFIGELRPIVEDVKDHDTGFYRMEKTTHRKYNDNMALGIRGLSNSTSTLNSETIQFINRMGYTARSHLSQYQGGSLVSDSLLGVKYVIDKKGSDKLVDSYEYVTTNGDYSAYLNPHALSIAYGVDSSVAELQLGEYYSYFYRMNTLVSTMLGDDDVGDIFLPLPTSEIDTALSANCEREYSSSQMTYSKIDDEGEATISYSFVAQESGEYYFYTPSRKPVETKLYINGEYSRKYLGKDSNNIVSLGYYEKDEPVNVTISLMDDDLTLYTHYNYVWYIDSEAFDAAFETLKSNPQFNVTEYTEDHLIGTISTSKEAQTIQTTIPYDKGWKIYLDGAEVETFKTLDALIAFNIDSAGEHSLEMRYDPDIYKIGAVISITALIIFAVICLLDLIAYFVLRKNERFSKHFGVKDTPWVLADFDEDSEQLSECVQNEEESKRTLRDYIAMFKFKKKDSSDSSDNDDSSEGEN